MSRPSPPTPKFGQRTPEETVEGRQFRSGTFSPISRKLSRNAADMAIANPLWGAPRIRGELKMLGIVVSERTLSRILRTVPRPLSQNWKTFLKNHATDIIAIDLFTVPTFTFKVLFVFVVLAHRRGKFCISMPSNTPRRNGLLNHWLRLLPTGMPRVTWSVIAIECTAD